MEMYSTLQKSVGDEEPISVYIIEDFEPYRETIQEIVNLEEDMYCDFVFESCEDYFSVFHQIPPPKVLLMDIAIPGKMDGIEGTRRIKELNPDIRVVMLTGSSDDEKIFKSRSSGAIGYIIKDDEPEVLIKKIREAANGEVAMSSTPTRIMQKMLEQKFKPKKK
nr:response regulator transcription factor [Rhodothermaceae bacterium]